MAGGNIVRITKSLSKKEVENYIVNATDGDIRHIAGESVIYQAKNHYFEEYEKSDDPINFFKYFVEGWWTDEKDQPITEAQVGDEVHFHIRTTTAVGDGEIIFITLFDHDVHKRRGPDEDNTDDIINLNTKEGPIISWKVKGHKAVIPITLTDDLIGLIRQEPDGKIELYFKCYYHPKDDLSEEAKLPDNTKNYLKVRAGTSLIIFVNGHYSGIWPGPSQPDKAYWDYFDEKMSGAAIEYFNVSDPYKIKYADGSTHNLFAYGSGQDRKDWGEQYAKDNLQEWKKIVGASTVYLIGHSEGCAFAAGIAKALTDNKIKVEEMVFLSCDEGDEFSIDYNIPTYQIEYMYFQKVYDIGGNYITESFDWVINTDKSSGGCKGVSKFGIIVNNRLGFQTVHGSTVDREIFKCIEDLKNVSAIQNFDSKGFVFYDQTATTNSTKFYMIDTHVIATNHPQWNSKTFEIDRSLPYNL